MKSLRLGTSPQRRRLCAPILCPSQRLGAKPYTPTLPANYRLRHDLKTTAMCLEAHRQLAQDVLEGKIAADAATYISREIHPAPHPPP